MGKGAYCMLVLILIFLTLNSCDRSATQSNKNKTEIVTTSRFSQLYPNFDKEELKANLKEYLKEDSTLLSFYQVSDYKPVWTDDTLNIERLKSVISIFNSIDRHGLPEYFFDKDVIQSLTLSIDSGVTSDSLYNKLVILDYMATNSVIKYITGMNYGFLKPNTLFGEDYDIDTLRPDSIFLQQLYTDIRDNAIVAMYGSLPCDSVYLRMQQEYGYWKNKVGYKPENIKEKGYNLVYKVGDENKNISALAERLVWTGEYLPDTADADGFYQTLTDDLMSAVNLFRTQNSYPEDQEIGAQTIEALNRPAEYYLSKLTANMERYRWKKVKRNSDSKHVDVNAASFKLIATQTDAPPLIMRVCVGSPKHKTPLLQSEFGYINLNPIWNVPKSIAKNEIFYLQKKDTTYLRRHNMRLYKGGQEVSHSAIDWQNQRISEHSYYIRQDPGSRNSLGRLKFMFKNSFSVYLHDTPAKRAFTRKNRAVSHGCIRLQQPIDFAFFCLSPSTDDYKDRLLYTIDQSPRTKVGRGLLQNNKLMKISDIVNLKDTISLTIDYRTVYMQPNDEMLYYADDVYEYDDIILNALAINNPKIKITPKIKEDLTDELF